MFAYLYFLIVLICYFYLKNNKQIELTLLTSNIFGTGNKKLMLFLYALIFPYTLLYLLKLKIKNVKKLLIFLSIVFVLYLGISALISKAITIYNQNVDIETTFDQRMKFRGTTFYTMRTQLKEQLHIAEINDSSYSELVKVIALSRRESPSLMWKWVQENNANINYNEVSTLYYKVFDNVSQLRERLLAVDQELQGIVKDWEVLHKKFPSNIFLFYTKRTLNYKPILSTEAQIVNDTGVDNNLNF